MPIPTPQPEEKDKEFLQRCMNTLIKIKDTVFV